MTAMTPDEQDKQARSLPRLTLNQRQCCDLECLLIGAFAPLTSFMTQQEYYTVIQDMRLPSGAFWPMPITLDINEQVANALAKQPMLALEDRHGFLLAVMTVTDIWQPDKEQEVQTVFGTDNEAHPGVSEWRHQRGAYYVGGPLQAIRLPLHFDFQSLRQTPTQLKQLFSERGWQRVIAFQTRNPMHKAHFYLTQQACRDTQANLLLHPAVGQTQQQDIDYATRVRCYQAILPRFAKPTTLLSLAPIAMRMAGPREALWHALIRKNYGCTHFIVGRDHASPSNNAKHHFYDTFLAQEMALAHQADLGIQIYAMPELAYQPSSREYVRVSSDNQHGVETISGRQLRDWLRADKPIPAWFSFPEVIRELQKTILPTNQRGFCVFFTGLSGAGKTALARALFEKINEQGGRTLSVLDGDQLRQDLSLELGFSKRDRDLNVQRAGYVAAEIVKHRGIIICAMIAPYEQTRQQVRERVNRVGHFIEVYVATPLAVCEQRDRKGLYRKARLGEIHDFTGISDPYEAPTNPELMIDTSRLSLEQATQQILLKLQQLQLL